MPDLGVFRAFTEGYILEMKKAYEASLSILNIIIPDNEFFSSEDATFMERRFGLIINPSVPLEDRKKAILRKMQHPSPVQAREHYLFIESQLQAAGFDVYVFENRFDDGMGGYETKTPEEVAISPISNAIQHGQVQHGQVQHGSTETYKIVNYLEPGLDSIFDVGDNLKSTFFISSSTLGLNAVIPQEREQEFRKLVLTLKPLQTVCFPFIGFTVPVESNQLIEDDIELIELEDDTLLQLEDSYD
tara:strand:- start:875 stop:1609 length:735 start_codon:yes stop_codon:yes gene_type:complete